MNETNAKPRHYGRIVLLGLLGFVLSLAVAFGLLIYNTDVPAPVAGPTGKKAVRSGPVGTSTSFAIGTTTPRITIVEFADFACPHCLASFSVIRELAARNADTIRYVYRDFPATNENSYILALAAHCAGAQGKFWPMHDQLFLNQGVSTAAELSELAKRIGLKMIPFTTCVNEEQTGEAVLANYDEGKALGVSAPPTWFINDEKIEGEIPADTFRKVIADLLNKN
jgi:protein-disulfide isomerase